MELNNSKYFIHVILKIVICLDLKIVSKKFGEKNLY